MVGILRVVESPCISQGFRALTQYIHCCERIDGYSSHSQVRWRFGARGHDNPIGVASHRSFPGGSSVQVLFLPASSKVLFNQTSWYNSRSFLNQMGDYLERPAMPNMEGSTQYMKQPVTSQFFHIEIAAVTIWKH